MTLIFVYGAISAFKNLVILWHIFYVKAEADVNQCKKNIIIQFCLMADYKITYYADLRGHQYS